MEARVPAEPRRAEAGAGGSAERGGIVARWCANEKTAYEAAVGVSLVGRRALVTMKHVGLNVAADPFLNSALLDIHGGLVVAVADDPGMHSSQSEQDSRFYADFARVICLEPRSQQEAYEMTREAFDLSERFHIPVVVRLVTRLSHSRAVVATRPPRPQNPLSKAPDKSGWVTLPSLSRRGWERLLAAQGAFRRYAEESPWNRLMLNERCSEVGVITTGLGGNYYEENLEELAVRPSHLHIGVYPLPVEKIRRLAERVRKIVVIEEGYPFVERYLRGLLPQAVEIAGKESGHLPASGELNPDNVRPAMGLGEKNGQELPGLRLPARPPQLCAGCPHRDTFEALNLAVAGFPASLVTSDIGCYTLGYLPPFESIETCLCMGASVGMAKGAAEAGFRPVVAVIGDSTFLHSGITPLLDAVAGGVSMTLIILDNGTTAMTGGQPTLLASGRIQELVRGAGVEAAHIRVIQPLRKHTQENARILREEMEYPGVSVVIALRECIQTVRDRKKAGAQA
jgi:indolepyruvate ferredoxin oxidoreductase alpha subunit